jgi:hypothetical protein
MQIALPANENQVRMKIDSPAKIYESKKAVQGILFMNKLNQINE